GRRRPRSVPAIAARSDRRRRSDGRPQTGARARAGLSLVDGLGRPDVTIDLDDCEPLDDSNPKVLDWLAKLQGNILKAHGRNVSVCVFFSFGDDIPDVK